MKVLLSLLPLSSALLIAPQAIAHGVALNYQAQQVVKITAHYDSGQPMANATVKVFAPNQPQQAVIQGATNAAGEFQFTPDQAGSWQVQVRQAGHGGNLTVPVRLDATPVSTAVQVTAAASPVSLSQYTPLQVSIMVLAVLWGAIGTACFAWSRRRVQVE
ncbi:carboxypeptidase-like regulatory domain-containing protein [Synechococcus sp. PCC 6717]|nr:carboxypeptidase-like regulatory domain-containing protein [Synechococcus sp. PCC 6717]